MPASHYKKKLETDHTKPHNCIQIMQRTCSLKGDSMYKPPNFTPYAEVNALLHEILESVQRILGNRFVGMYLHGSLANGDFDPKRSDIDYLVVTAEALPQDKIAELEHMHARIRKSDVKWQTNFEGSYISAKAIRRHEPADSTHPAIRADGSFGMDGHGNEWIIQRYIIREKGITLAGPEPKTLIDSISANDLRQATRNLLHEWWAPQLLDSHRLNSSDYQAYAILTMCRALYTIAFGTVVSKPTAANWAGETFLEWSQIIQKAMTWEHGMECNLMAEALELIAFTLEKVRVHP